jgi:hypothetical protein
MRKTRTGISAVHAGCFECDKTWETRNALALAARHHDSTGHATWCDQVLIVRYGDTPEERSRDSNGARGQAE